MVIYPDTKLEEKLWSQGYILVAGLDEAGRGPLAGPVVAGCVVITSIEQVVPFVRDSKKMTEKKREEAFKLITEKSFAFGYGIVSASDIDRMGIQKAVLEAMRIALEVVEEKIGKRVDFIMADGKNISTIPNYKMEKITQGDLLHYSISAGSVIAKVVRDRIMYDYAKKYPIYGFEKHVGYGTKYHMDVLKRHGPCIIHRRSFKPIDKLIYRG
ncbi:MAG: Ribonuclease HII [candidate division WS6 bacterium GW2011_GWE1_34_7]|uniref:Ribonuclease HII n=1 Tax=candidate division WS6 bacterium GW2011_GWE1_34_7 TaxID=1619093 RepID=A0A0G0B4J7_9BACT|nr:MAG: Ribonuclease HII [candidate division WS6 bacterium GW2011_GWE1_34_7]